MSEQTTLDGYTKAELHKIVDIYNLGFGKEIKIYKAIKILSNEMKKNLPINQIKKTPLDIYSSFANIDKIKMHGVRPKISLRKGIIKMINKTKKL